MPDIPTKKLACLASLNLFQTSVVKKLSLPGKPESDSGFKAEIAASMAQAKLPKWQRNGLFCLKLAASDWAKLAFCCKLAAFAWAKLAFCCKLAAFAWEKLAFCRDLAAQG